MLLKNKKIVSLKDFIFVLFFLGGGWFDSVASMFTNRWCHWSVSRFPTKDSLVAVGTPTFVQCTKNFEIGWLKFLCWRKMAFWWKSGQEGKQERHCSYIRVKQYTVEPRFNVPRLHFHPLNVHIPDFLSFIFHLPIFAYNEHFSNVNKLPLYNVRICYVPQGTLLRGLTVIPGQNSEHRRTNLRCSDFLFKQK